MTGIHGGDIYRNQVRIDFSVNVNPLGMPKAAETALHSAVADCCNYPDMEAGRLKKAVSKMLQIPEEWLLFGNGASELFMAIVYALRPKKTVIPVPSFFGYEYAAGIADGEIIFYETKAEDSFALGEGLLSVLTEDIELLFLANPNNPTGNLMDKEYLIRVLRHCREKEIWVVLDECFIEFCGSDKSILHAIADMEKEECFENLILVRAFTKIFAIPGVRLGYLISRDRRILERIKRQLPEWNISCFAQAAGCACASQKKYREKTEVYIKQERAYLENGLRELGFFVFSGEANYILYYSEYPLYGELLKKGMLIRDCENFRGLSRGFYRIAVKCREENEALLQAIKEITKKMQDGERDADRSE